MNGRDHQFVSLYKECRFNDQLDYYERRISEYASAHEQAVTLAGFLMFAASVAAIIAASPPGTIWKPWAAAFAALFPLTSTAVAAFERLCSFEQQAKLYGDAATSLKRIRAEAPDLRPSNTDDDYRNALAAYVDRVERIFRREQGQWGQLVRKAEESGAVEGVDAVGGPGRAGG